MQLEAMQTGAILFGLCIPICLIAAINRNAKYRHIVIRMTWISASLTFALVALILFRPELPESWLDQFRLGSFGRYIFAILFAIAAVTVAVESIFAGDARLAKYLDNILSPFERTKK